MSEAHSTCASAEKPEVEYREVAGFRGYRVGNDGSVWSCRRGKWKKMAGHFNDSGYVVVKLPDERGRNVRKFVHRLILEAFVGPCPDGMEGMHFPDHSKTNNALSNLSWGTHQTNMSQLSPAMSGCHLQKLNSPIVREIRCAVARGMSIRATAKVFGITHTHVRKIVRGEKWKSRGPATT